eukprot:3537813-Pleurochrysis_carterae.AAC.1
MNPQVRVRVDGEWGRPPSDKFAPTVEPQTHLARSSRPAPKALDARSERSCAMAHQTCPLKPLYPLRALALCHAHTRAMM